MQHEATSYGDMSATYSTPEIAALMRVSRPTVGRWIADGRLAAFDIGTPGRPRLRVTEASLREFMARGRIERAS